MSIWLWSHNSIVALQLDSLGKKEHDMPKHHQLRRFGAPRESRRPGFHGLSHKSRYNHRDPIARTSNHTCSSHNLKTTSTKPSGFGNEGPATPVRKTVASVRGAHASRQGLESQATAGPMWSFGAAWPLSQRVPSTLHLGLLVPNIYPEWYLGPETSNMGYLDPLGV